MDIRRKTLRNMPSVLARRSCIWWLAVVTYFMMLWSANLYALPPNFQMETLVSGLQQPVFLTELPDGRLLILQKAGIIQILNPNEQAPEPTVYLDISTTINTGGERGLTAIALDPNFQANGYLYVYYASSVTRRNRMSRFTHTGSTVDPASEVVLWENPEIFKDFHHYGGGIGFGPDGALYFATGDEFDGLQSQDLTTADGKILRINPDGSIPADNPFADGPGGNMDEIWALGLRNPFRGYWDLVTGRFYIGDVGGNVEETAREEINVILPGRNYGWPECEGQCVNPAFEDPLHDYDHFLNPSRVGGSITLGEVYHGLQFPAEYVGGLFYADYVQRWIRYLKFNPDGSVASDNVFADNDEAGLVVHLIFGQDGSLYLVDVSGSIKRIRYIGGNQPPAIQQVTHTPQPGPAPAQVTFEVSASDPEGDSLSYLWYTGDGAALSGQTVTHEYAQNGVYEARVQVSDGVETVLSETLTVQVGVLPTAVISAPQDGATFRAGDLVNFEGGTSSDPDGSLGEWSYSWDIRFGHNVHTHPTLTGYTGSSGTLEINTSGHDYHSNTRYEFELTVTDSDGLTATDTVIVYPEKADLVLNTSPVALSVSIDSIQQETPIIYDTLIGFQHVVSAPAVRCVEGTQYVFAGWSDGGASSHEVIVPETGLELTAQYSVAGDCTGVIADGLVLNLDADQGVLASGGGLVQGWEDQSGSGNHLTGVGDPQLLSGVLNGNSVLVFDGYDDKLERLSGVTGLPADNTDRTVFLVINYQSAGHGGFGYGNTACNQVFSPSVNKKGQLMLQGWCGDTDFHTTVPGTGEGWLVHSAVLRSGVLEHYRNGQLIDSFSHTFATVPERLMIGAELDSRPHVAMQLATALVYDRALTSSEIAQMHEHLALTYLPPAEPQPPVAGDDSASVESNGSVVIDLLGNDAAVGSATLVAELVEIISAPSQGVVQVDVSTGAATYTHLGGEGGTDTFTYQVTDSSGQVSNTATVTLSIVNNGGQNQAPVSVDDAVTVNQGDLVLIDVLANDQDPDGTLNPASVTVEAGPSAGEVTLDPDTGGIFYQHDGTTTSMDSFQYRVSDVEGLASNLATVSIGVVLTGDGPPLAFDDAAGVTWGQNSIINVLVNDIAVSGSLDPSSVFITALPGHGSVVADPVTGQVEYTHNGLSGTSDSFGYQVLDTQGLTSNEATVSVTIGNFGFGGLALHLEADSGVTTGAGGVVQAWADQAGSGNDLTGVGDPTLLPTGLNGHPVIEFDGSGDTLERLGGLAGLPQGNSDRTMVLLIRYDGNGHGGVGYGATECNQVFAPSVNKSGELMVQGWCGETDFHTSVPGAGAGWLVQSVVYAGGQLDHFRNGELIDSFVHSFNTTAERLMIGAEIDGRPYVPMQLGAVLLFDTALSPDELASVEDYLTDKYGLK